MNIFIPINKFLLLSALVLQVGNVFGKNPSEPLKLPQEINSAMVPTQFSGTGKLTFFGLNVYDASLWVSSGFKANDFDDHPFALELQYLRDFTAEKIAKRSIEEMQRLEKIPDPTAEQWLARLTEELPSVNKGDRLIGVHKPGSGVTFWLNGKRKGEIRDAEFARRFFAIWLSPKTSEPKLRKALLGNLN